MKNYGLVAKILHWTVFAFCLYAIGCCGFHWLPVWGLSENYESINTTLLSLALSYIAGYIIYLFTSKWPQKQRERDIFILWRPHLSDLYNEMALRIEELRAFLGISEDTIEQYSVDGCKAFENYTALPSNIVLHKEIDKGEEEPLRMVDEFNIKRDLNRHHDLIEQYLLTMLDNPIAFEANKRILDTLSKIRSSVFIKKCDSIIGGPIDDEQITITITTPEMPQAFVDYVKLRDELGQFPIQKFSFKVRKMSDEEVEESEKGLMEELAKRGLTKEMASNIQKKIADASRR